MLFDEIKAAMVAAMKAKNTTEKEILRTCIGELTGTGETPDDAKVQAVLRKALKNNEETLKVVVSADQKATLEAELLILKRYLPQALGQEQIIAALSAQHDAIRAAGNAGQATGIAMKQLKAAGLEAQGKDVSLAIETIRSN
jgi:uncharacterized protein YqeY